MAVIPHVFINMALPKALARELEFEAFVLGLRSKRRVIVHVLYDYIAERKPDVAEELLRDPIFRRAYYTPAQLKELEPDTNHETAD